MPLLKKNAPKRVAKTFKSLPRKLREQPGKAATAIGLVAAGAAGVLAARKKRANGGGTVLHVRASDGAGWILTRGSSGKPLERFEQKREAVEAGRELAKKRGPSTLLIHRSNGTIARRHVFEGS